jgi:hypothetical protein
MIRSSRDSTALQGQNKRFFVSITFFDSFSYLYVMNSIRGHFLSKVTAFIAGLAFLNMSFFLAEVSLLNFKKQELLENIANLILNTGFEEEREAESSNENTIKEILVVQQVQVHGTSSFLISIGINSMLVNHYQHANHSLTFSPPPDTKDFS